MPSITEINSLDRSGFTALLGNLFEHSPWIAEETWTRRPFRDAAHLHDELCATLRGASRDQLAALIRAHPDLAGRLARQKQLTANSTREQASAGLDRLTDAEAAEFEKLNRSYRARFRFPFIICARLHAKEAIVRAMRARLTNSLEVEFATAIAEIEKIARLRLEDALKPAEQG